MSTATQSNVQHGPLVLPAYEDLTGREGRLVKIVSDSGAAKVALPSDDADRCLYLLLEGAEAGESVALEPLTPAKQFRVKFSGTCVPGDRFTLADSTQDAKRGCAAKLEGSSAGSYFVFGIAEESAVDGQLVKFRPCIEGVVTIT